MDADAHGLESGLTEAVIGSAFEVANVLGAGFLEKVYERALIRELALRGVSAKAQVSFPVCYKEAVRGRICGGFVGRGKAHGRTKVCRSLCQRASGPVHQLLESLWPSCGPADQFPKAQGGLETGSSG